MNGKYKDFQSSLEFLLDYGFEFSKDSETGRKKCYKNEYGEIVLRSKQIDANYYIPQICIEINQWKKIIDIKKEYLLINEKKPKKFYDMVHDVIKNQLNYNKIFDLRINAKYHRQINYLRIINNLDNIKEYSKEALSGVLKCNCGSHKFHIYHTGKQTKGILSSDIVKYKGQIIIYAKCLKCKETIKVLDTNIDGIKPKEIQQQKLKKFILKKDIDIFEITLMYNYYKKDYKTNRFVECFIAVENEKLIKPKRIYE